MQNRETASSTNANKKLYWIIGGLSIVAVSAVAVILLIYFNPSAAPTSYADTRPVVTERPVLFVNENNVEEIRKQLNEPVEDGYFKTKMSVDWNFKNGSSVSDDAFVTNSEDNTRMVYFDVILRDTDETVYSSPYLPTGTTLDEIELDKSLSAGDHNAIVTCHLVDDDKQELSTVSVAVTIHVLN